MDARRTVANAGRNARFYSVAAVQGARAECDQQSGGDRGDRRRLAAGLRPGDVVLVEGELGAGKTTFVRGACRRARRHGAGHQSHLHDRPALPRRRSRRRPSRPLPARRRSAPRIRICSPTTSARTRSPSSNGRRGGAGDRPRSPGRPPRPAGACRRRPPPGGDPVRILAFDTATPATVTALCDFATGGVRAEARRRSAGRAASRARHRADGTDRRPAASEPARAGRTLDRIAVGVGPGTFTGLRIGVATARALAQAHGLPLVGVSTLAVAGRSALAASGPKDAMPSSPCIDARRGEVFAAAWSPSDLRATTPRRVEPRRFPASTLAAEALTPSDSRRACPWLAGDR